MVEFRFVASSFEIVVSYFGPCPDPFFNNAGPVYSIISVCCVVLVDITNVGFCRYADMAVHGVASDGMGLRSEDGRSFQLFV